MLNQLLPQAATDAPIERVLHAIANPTRRAIVEQLSRGPATVKELAGPLRITLSAVVQQVHVLEASGLVRSHKAGRVRTCSIEPSALSTLERWINERRAAWEKHLHRLGEYLAETEPLSESES
jgi:DNA-binding transcriptional ArsR family regulator